MSVSEIATRVRRPCQRPGSNAKGSEEHEVAERALGVIANVDPDAAVGQQHI
jgi:hypothetical protein